MTTPYGLKPLLPDALHVVTLDPNDIDSNDISSNSRKAERSIDKKDDVKNRSKINETDEDTKKNENVVDKYLTANDLKLTLTAQGAIVTPLTPAEWVNGNYEGLKHEIGQVFREEKDNKDKSKDANGESVDKHGEIALVSNNSKKDQKPLFNAKKIRGAFATQQDPPQIHDVTGCCINLGQK